MQEVDSGLKKVSSKLANQMYQDLENHGYDKVFDKEKFVKDKSKEFFDFLKKEYKIFYSELDNAVKTIFENLTAMPKSESERVMQELVRSGELVESISAKEIVEAANRGKTPQTMFKLSDETMRIFFKIASNLLEQGEYNKAASVSRFLSLLNPESVEYWVSYGYALRGLQKSKDALHSFEIGSMLNPKHPLPRLYLVETYIALNRKEEASRELSILNDLVEEQNLEAFRDLVDQFQNLIGV